MDGWITGAGPRHARKEPRSQRIWCRRTDVSEIESLIQLFVEECEAEERNAEEE